MQVEILRPTAFQKICEIWPRELDPLVAIYQSPVIGRLEELDRRRAELQALILIEASLVSACFVSWLVEALCLLRIRLQASFGTCEAPELPTS